MKISDYELVVTTKEVVAATKKVADALEELNTLIQHEADLKEKRLIQTMKQVFPVKRKHHI